jgi:hypothetical protein
MAEFEIVQIVQQSGNGPVMNRAGHAVNFDWGLQELEWVN